MLKDFNKKFQDYLNADGELGRRLKGFKNFSGTPDGHYIRARKEGEKAIARAVKCYPFGGKSFIENNSEIIGINITGTDEKILISLVNEKFIVQNNKWNKPFLTINLPLEKFKKAVLGRYRWIWLLGLDDVEVSYSEEIPHSDWVTIFEILVAMQELPEFDNSLIEKVEGF